MKEFLYYNQLFDLYGSLLTEKECEAFKDYYQEDFSLSEIAENKNISRTAVQKTIKKVLDKLNYFEEKLHLEKKNNALQELLSLNDIDTIKRELNKILEK